jgi:acyl-CoA synthetase (NDP forming)
MVGGTETIVGASVDAHFGPIVMFGLGGVFTELIHDVSHRFAPFGIRTAREMIAETKAHQLLQGYRGNPPGDVDALAEVLSRISFLIADYADVISEMDVNPLFVRPVGQGVIVADALIVLRRGGSTHSEKRSA